MFDPELLSIARDLQQVAALATEDGDSKIAAQCRSLTSYVLCGTASPKQWEIVQSLRFAYLGE